MFHDYIEKLSLFVINEEMNENVKIIDDINKKLKNPEIKIEPDEKENLKTIINNCQYTVKTLLDLLNNNVINIYKFI